MMKFKWNMAEDDWKRLKDVQVNHTYTENNFFGSVECGAVLVEFMHTVDPSAWYPCVNAFCYGYDNGYGILKNGVPYGDVDWDMFGDNYNDNCEDYNSYEEYLNWFLGTSFEQFKKRVENAIDFAVNWDSYEIMREYVQKPFGDWR